MSNLMHLFKVNQKVKCNVDGKFFNGTVKETYEDHIIIDVPEISDHMWYEEGLNIGDVYHMEKIDNNIQLAFLGGMKVGLEALIHGLEVVAKNNNGQVSFEFVKMVSARACLKNKSYTKHKSYYCLLILKISKINIIYIIIDIF